MALAQRMSDAIRDHIELGGRTMQVTVSIGIVLADSRRGDPESVLRDADAAMYRAKELGRARFELFDDSVRERVMERLETEAALRLAIENDELRLVFQPEVSLTDGTVVGVEALVRWQHPDRACSGPGAFLPLAEETGLIVPMGTWALDQACRHATEWRGNHRDAAVRGVGQPLGPPALRTGAAAAGGRHRGDHRRRSDDGRDRDHRERADGGHRGGGRRPLRALKALGLKLAIDDFGTGFSSLSYLKRFPVDVLKVDQSFVAGLGQDDGDSAIVRAVIELAHALGLTAVAEGVETAGQMAALRRLGCDTAQGYYFDAPGARPPSGACSRQAPTRPTPAAACSCATTTPTRACCTAWPSSTRA